MIFCLKTFHFTPTATLVIAKWLKNRKHFFLRRAILKAPIEFVRRAGDETQSRPKLRWFQGDENSLSILLMSETEYIFLCKSSVISGFDIF